MQHSSTSNDPNRDIIVMGVLFVLIGFFFKVSGFWSFLGLEEPRGFFIQGLLFLVLMFVFHNLVFKHFLNIHMYRSSETKGKREQAQAKTHQALEMEKEYIEAIEYAKIKAFEDKQSILLDAENQERELLQEARLKHEAELKLEKEKIKTHFDQVQVDLQKQIPMLTDEIFSRVMESPSAKAKL